MAIESGAFLVNLDTPGTWFVSDDKLAQDLPFGGGDVLMNAQAAVDKSSQDVARGVR